MSISSEPACNARLPVRPFLAEARCIVWFAFALCLHLMFATPAGAQPTDSEQLDHFEWVRTIALSDPDTVHPDGLLIGWIWSIDVGPDGRLLVVDYRGEQTLLFDPDGRLLAVLDPTLCHPGFWAVPVNGRFVGDQSIFVSNGGSPRGYRFTSEGDCLGSVDPEYQLIVKGRFLDVGPQSNLFGAYQFPDRQVVRRMNSSGKTLHEFELPSSEYPNATDRIAMGGLVVDERHVFYAGVADPHILKLMLDGTVVTKFSQRTAWFRDVSEDLRDRSSGIGVFGNPVGEFWGNNTLVYNLLRLTDETIMIQYRNSSRGWGYQVFTKGGVLVAEELGIRLPFDFAKDGLAYFVVQPDQDYLGEIPNPHIDVYRFILPE